MKNALVVVDMQRGFPAALSKKTIRNVVKEIQRARARNDLIIILRYTYCGNVLKPILDAVRGYENLVRVNKNDDDGSHDIKRYLADGMKIRICGVNTDCCVRDTAEGVSQIFKKSVVQVIMRACNTDEEDKSSALDGLISSTTWCPNLEVIEGRSRT